MLKKKRFAHIYLFLYSPVKGFIGICCLKVANAVVKWPIVEIIEESVVETVVEVVESTVVEIVESSVVERSVVVKGSIVKKAVVVE